MNKDSDNNMNILLFAFLFNVFVPFNKVFSSSIVEEIGQLSDSFAFSTDKLEQIVQDVGIIEANEISDQIKKEIGIFNEDNVEDFGRKIVSIKTTAKYHEEDFMDIERKFADAFDIMGSLF